MKAIVCVGKGGVDVLSEKADAAEPELREHDVLVDLKACAVNPVDGKNRANNMSGQEERILGYDGAGIVKKLGAKVDSSRFQVGTEVFFAGDVTRNGTNAELVAVDSRIVGLKPKSLSFAQAAAVPLVAITAWEPLFENLRLATDGSDGKGKTFVMLNGAGGVGSAAIQIAKHVAGFENVVASASRDETEAWCRKLGATHIINHRKNLKEELERVGLSGADVIFCGVDLDVHYDAAVEAANMGAAIIAITVKDASKIDVSKMFFPKRLTLSFEIMFGRPMLNQQPELQGQLLDAVASLIDAKKFLPIDNETLKGLSVDSIRKAQELQDSGKAIGKIVVEF